jgi:hypothetical protein
MRFRNSASIAAHCLFAPSRDMMAAGTHVIDPISGEMP